MENPGSSNFKLPTTSQASPGSMASSTPSPPYLAPINDTSMNMDAHHMSNRP